MISQAPEPRVKAALSGLNPLDSCQSVVISLMRNEGYATLTTTFDTSLPIENGGGQMPDITENPARK